MFREAFRVLRAGGVFIVLDIPDGWLHRVGHTGSTFTPLEPNAASRFLSAAGFSGITMDSRKAAFRLMAVRPS
jgi:hypothetical protein